MEDIRSSARLYGSVRLGEHAHIAQGCVVRSESGSVAIGAQTAILENSVVIGTEKAPVKVGAKTIFGHKCIVIGAEIGNLCEIGNGTLFLPGSKLGDRCITGEGTLVPANTNIPAGSVIVGRPGRVIRSLTKADAAMIKRMRGGDIALPQDTNIRTIENTRGENMGTLYAYKGKKTRAGRSRHPVRFRRNNRRCTNRGRIRHCLRCADYRQCTRTGAYRQACTDSGEYGTAFIAGQRIGD